MAMREVERQPVAVFKSVERAVEGYKSQPHTRELITQVFRAVWQERGKLVGAIYEVDRCLYTREELITLEKQRKRVGYLPPELATQENRHLLGKMFPKMKSHSVQEDNSVTNDGNSSGWFDYEAGIDTPYFNTDERQLIERIVKDGREILSLNQYIVAGQDSKLLMGRYLDEKTAFVRLGSRSGGRVVCAYFDPDGCLVVDRNLEPGYHSRALGGRSSGVKKA